MTLKLVAPIVACLAAGAASAQVLSGAEAERAVDNSGNYMIQVSGALGPADQKTVAAIVPLMAEQLRQPVRHFATIAYSPDQGLASEALQIAMNHHTIEASDRAAVAACNAARAAGTRGCQIAARVVPRGFSPGGFTLSAEATRSLLGPYKRRRGAKALAISPSTGAFGLGGSDAEAMANCTGTAIRPRDCRVVVRDP